jgi:hypothetical protein
VSWSFGKRCGRGYEDAIKVRGVDEEYSLIRETSCDRCKARSYVKDQGGDGHAKYANGGFFDILHCRCRNCGSTRDFFFDVSELPSFKILFALAEMGGERMLEGIGSELNKIVQPITGACEKCGTPYRLRIGQAMQGVPCAGCGLLLQVGM